MLRTLALWLLHIIEGKLDPDLQARLDRYREQKAAMEAQETEAQTAIAELEGKLAQLNTQRAAIQTNLAEAERAASQSEEERRSILNEKTYGRSISDADALRSKL
jgi:septal ring factor EnvC (AmiA/AmiB activator)